MVLSVLDTGAGMDPETLARAQEPFFTTKGIGKGTGLGLSMVHGLAEQSKGRLQLRSEQGKGTTAEIWLPVAPQTEKPEVVPLQRSVPSQPVRTATILLVDDDLLVLENTIAMLEDLGHRVIGAHSGPNAIVSVTPAVDLVITDQAMPSMTGVQLAEELRSRNPNLPVILASGYAEIPEHEHIDLPRLSKPYDQAALARVINEVLFEPVLSRHVRVMTNARRGP